MQQLLLWRLPARQHLAGRPRRQQPPARQLGVQQPPAQHVVLQQLLAPQRPALNPLARRLQAQQHQAQYLLSPAGLAAAQAADREGECSDWQARPRVQCPQVLAEMETTRDGVRSLAPNAVVSAGERRS